MFQLSQHNKELSNLLKPCGDLYGDQALEFYAKHTAQIEVSYTFTVLFSSVTLLFKFTIHLSNIMLRTYYGYNL